MTIKTHVQKRPKQTKSEKVKLIKRWMEPPKGRRILNPVHRLHNQVCIVQLIQVMNWTMKDLPWWMVGGRTPGIDCLFRKSFANHKRKVLKMDKIPGTDAPVTILSQPYNLGIQQIIYFLYTP